MERHSIRACILTCNNTGNESSSSSSPSRDRFTVEYEYFEKRLDSRNATATKHQYTIEQKRYCKGIRVETLPSSSKSTDRNFDTLIWEPDCAEFGFRWGTRGETLQDCLKRFRRRSNCIECLKNLLSKLSQNVTWSYGGGGTFRDVVMRVNVDDHDQVTDLHIMGKILYFYRTATLTKLEFIHLLLVTLLRRETWSSVYPNFFNIPLNSPWSVGDFFPPLTALYIAGGLQLLQLTKKESKRCVGKGTYPHTKILIFPSLGIAVRRSSSVT